jgi:hypothetical protein
VNDDGGLSATNISTIYNNGVANTSQGYQVVPTGTSASPYYTTSSNPQSSTLVGGESEIVSFFVNATGSRGTISSFFTIANFTSSITILNTSELLNGTIIEDNFNASPNISVQNTFVNVTSVSISSSVGTCNNIANNSNGVFFNATYNCSGPPFQSSNIQITFCTALDACNTTTLSTNDYPNQVPVAGSLLLPADGNETLINRTVSFFWNPATDAEGDDVNYTINVSNSFCPNYVRTNLSSTTHITDTELRTDFECLGNNYFWSIQACDQWNCSAYTAEFNFSIAEYLAITIVNDTLNFSNVEVDTSYSTDDGTPEPFIFRNDGNVNANLTNLNSTGLWSSVALDTLFFQFKANYTSEGAGFDNTNSIMSYTPVSGTTSGIVVADLNYSDSADEAAIDINITVPSSEPSGEKSGTIEFVWEVAS